MAAKHENFRKTAESLYISQPSVTLHIRNLESTLSTELFVKKGRNIFLTDEGKEFLPYAFEILDSYSKGRDRIKSFKQGYKKRITLAVAPYIASSVLPSFLKQFFKENTYIDIKVNIVKSNNIGIEVLNKKADIGISRMIPHEENIKHEMIWEDQIILVGPRNGENSGSIDREDYFRKYKILTNNHPVYWGDLLQKVHKIYPYSRTMEVTQVEITKQFIKSGLGISFLPNTIVQEEINQEYMVNIPFSDFELPLSNTYFIWGENSEEIKKFKLALQKYLHNF